MTAKPPVSLGQLTGGAVQHPSMISRDDAERLFLGCGPNMSRTRRSPQTIGGSPSSV
jgi:hypothetical protein